MLHEAYRQTEMENQSSAAEQSGKDDLSLLYIQWNNTSLGTCQTQSEYKPESISIAAGAAESQVKVQLGHCQGYWKPNIAAVWREITSKAGKGKAERKSP